MSLNEECLSKTITAERSVPTDPLKTTSSSPLSADQQTQLIQSINQRLQEKNAECDELRQEPAPEQNEPLKTRFSPLLSDDIQSTNLMLQEQSAEYDMSGQEPSVKQDEPCKTTPYFPLSEDQQTQLIQLINQALQEKVAECDALLQELNLDQEDEATLRTCTYLQISEELWKLVAKEMEEGLVKRSSDGHIELRSHAHPSDQILFNKVRVIIDEGLISGQFNSQLERGVYRMNTAIKEGGLSAGDATEQRRAMFVLVSDELNSLLKQLEDRVSQTFITQLRTHLIGKLKIYTQTEDTPVQSSPVIGAHARQQDTLDQPETIYKDRLVSQLEEELKRCASSYTNSPFFAHDKEVALKQILHKAFDEFYRTLSDGVDRGKLTDDDKYRIMSELNERVFALPIMKQQASYPTASIVDTRSSSTTTQSPSSCEESQEEINRYMLALARGRLNFFSASVRQGLADYCSKRSDLTRESWGRGPGHP